MDWSLLGSSVHGILQAILKWGCHSLLWGIFPTEESNLRLLHSKWNLYRWATSEALNLNFLIPERCLLQRFAIRTEFDHIREVLRSWRMTRFLSALLPLLYTREVSKQTGSIQNFLNYKLLPSLKSCVQTIFLEIFSRVINSVTQSYPALCDPMDFSTPGLPVYHQLPEFTQTRVHWVSDVIQPPHPLSSLSPPTFNLSQHQGLF